MAELQENSGEAAVPGPNGAHDPSQTGAPAGETSASPEGSAADESQSGLADPGSREAYVQRIRSDPDFAQEQIDKLTQHNSRQNTQIQRLQPLENLASQLGSPETLVTTVQNLAGVLQHPDVRRVWDHYAAHRTLPTDVGSHDSADDADEYLSDEQRELRELRAEVSGLKSQLTTTQTGIGKNSFRSMMEVYREKFGDSVFQDVILPKIETTLDKWDQTAEGRALLANPQQSTLDSIVGTAVMEDLDRVVDAQSVQRAARLKGRETPAPAGNVTTGRESPGEGPAKSMREVLDDLKRTEGINLSRG